MEADFNWSYILLFWGAVFVAWVVANKLVKPMPPENTHAHTRYDAFKDR